MRRLPEQVLDETFLNMMSISPDGLRVIVGSEYHGQLYAWYLDLPERPPPRCLLPATEGPSDYYFRKRILWRPGLPSAFIPC
jgi:hypothetical protein